MWSPDFHSTLLPREKIQRWGVEYLTTEELIRAILGSGSRLLPVSKLSRIISHKLTTQTKSLSLSDILTVPGMGLAKACQIIAALELVERLRPRDLAVITSIKDALDQVIELRDSTQERVMCLYLNARQQLVHKETVAIGGLNQLALLPRDIFRPLRHHPVLYLIVAHNHPSGEPAPSIDDLTWTHRMHQACQLMGIELLDHLIVAKTNQYSLRDHQDLPTDTTFSSLSTYLPDSPTSSTTSDNSDLRSERSRSS